MTPIFQSQVPAAISAPLPRIYSRPSPSNPSPPQALKPSDSSKASFPPGSLPSRATAIPNPWQPTQLDPIAASPTQPLSNLGTLPSFVRGPPPSNGPSTAPTAAQRPAGELPSFRKAGVPLASPPYPGPFLTPPVCRSHATPGRNSSAGQGSTCVPCHCTLLELW